MEIGALKMGKLKKINTEIEGVFVIEPTVFEDNRGFFMGYIIRRILKK